VPGGVAARRARRGDQEAWTFLDEAIANADRSGDPELILASYSARAEAHWLARRRNDAINDIGVAAATTTLADPWTRGAIAVWQRRLDTVQTEVLTPRQRLLAGRCAAAGCAQSPQERNRQPDRTRPGSPDASVRCST
jgi:hypothetical protein